MRKIKNIAAVALVLTAILAFTGCSCNRSSSDSSNGNNVTSSSQTSSNAQPKEQTPENYIDGKSFDLTSYAEGLGYQRIEDPEVENTVLYCIEKNGVKYFFSYDGNMIYLFIDSNDGYVYNARPVECSTSPDDYILVSKGQDNRTISKETFDKITKLMEYIASNNNIAIESFPVIKTIVKCQGAAKYHSNGLIKYKEFGKTVELINCQG